MWLVIKFIVFETCQLKCQSKYIAVSKSRWKRECPIAISISRKPPAYSKKIWRTLIPPSMLKVWTVALITRSKLSTQPPFLLASKSLRLWALTASRRKTRRSTSIVLTMTLLKPSRLYAEPSERQRMTALKRDNRSPKRSLSTGWNIWKTRRKCCHFSLSSVCRITLKSYSRRLSIEFATETPSVWRLLMSLICMANSLKASSSECLSTLRTSVSWSTPTRATWPACPIATTLGTRWCRPTRFRWSPVTRSQRVAMSMERNSQLCASGYSKTLKGKVILSWKRRTSLWRAWGLSHLKLGKISTPNSVSAWKRKNSGTRKVKKKSSGLILCARSSLIEASETPLV